MKATAPILAFFLLTGLALPGWAQATTGGRSGGSSASTGAGYTSPGKRPAASKPASMTIADEGASRDYMYVPPAKESGRKNRSASPDGSGNPAGQTSRPANTAPKQSSGKP